MPVYHIHGGRDRTLPVGNCRPDVVVPGGGHLLPFTHPEEVNAFLRLRMEQHLRGGAALTPTPRSP